MIEAPILKMTKDELPIFVESVAIAARAPGAFLEIGVAKATSTAVLLETLARIGVRRPVYSIEIGHGSRKHHARAVARHGAGVEATLIEADSKAFRFDPPVQLCWIYFDGAHEPASAVVADVANWAPYLALDGVALFHDSRRPAVARAIRGTMTPPAFVKIAESASSGPGMAAYLKACWRDPKIERVPGVDDLAADVLRSVGLRPLTRRSMRA